MKSWDLNDLLSNSSTEMMLSVSDIVLQTAIYSDYAFTNDEIREEADRLTRIGITQRLVVERIGQEYVLLGPILPFLALQSMNTCDISCIVRHGDIPQIQQVLSMQLNAQYSPLSPLVYSRLIAHLQRIYPVIRSLSGMNPGIKRTWIAGILGLSSSAVLRYSYISKAPAALQLRCNQPQFPYLCLRETQHFTESQYHQLLEDLIHYELHSRYQTITAAEFSEMIRNAARSSIVDAPYGANSAPPSTDSNDMTRIDTAPVDDAYPPVERPVSRSSQPMPALFETLTERNYGNLQDSFEDQLDDDSDSEYSSDLIAAARNNTYIVPDQVLRDVAYQLYCLTQARLAGGQRLLNYACLRSILDSVAAIYPDIT